MGPVLFNIFTDVDDGTECTPSKADNGTRLGVTDKPGGCAAIQRDVTGWNNGLRETLGS